MENIFFLPEEKGDPRGAHTEDGKNSRGPLPCDYPQEGSAWFSRGCCSVNWSAPTFSIIHISIRQKERSKFSIICHFFSGIHGTPRFVPLAFPDERLPSLLIIMIINKSNPTFPGAEAGGGDEIFGYQVIQSRKLNFGAEKKMECFSFVSSFRRREWKLMDSATERVKWQVVVQFFEECKFYLAED